VTEAMTHCEWPRRRRTSGSCGDKRARGSSCPATSRIALRSLLRRSPGERVDGAAPRVASKVVVPRESKSVHKQSRPGHEDRSSLTSKEPGKVVQIHAAVVVAVENGVENATRLRLSLLHFRTRIAEDFRQCLRAFLRSLLGGAEDLAEHGRQDLAEDFLRGL